MIRHSAGLRFPLGPNGVRGARAQIPPPQLGKSKAASELLAGRLVAGSRGGRWGPLASLTATRTADRHSPQRVRVLAAAPLRCGDGVRAQGPAARVHQSSALRAQASGASYVTMDSSTTPLQYCSAETAVRSSEQVRGDSSGCSICRGPRLRYGGDGWPAGVRQVFCNQGL